MPQPSSLKNFEYIQCCCCIHTFQIDPQSHHFQASHFDKGLTAMAEFWADCHEAMMVNMHKRNREKGESKLKFQVNLPSVLYLQVLHKVFNQFAYSLIMRTIPFELQEKIVDLRSQAGNCSCVCFQNIPRDSGHYQGSYSQPERQSWPLCL